MWKLAMEPNALGEGEQNRQRALFVRSVDNHHGVGKVYREQPLRLEGVNSSVAEREGRRGSLPSMRERRNLLRRGRKVVSSGAKLKREPGEGTIQTYKRPQSMV